MNVARIAIFLFTLCACGQPPTDIDPGTGQRALSLFVLQALVQECADDVRDCPGAVRHLGGLTQINGILFDRDNRDIILVGHVDPTARVLDLIDLVVLLRNSWYKYVEAVNGEKRFTYPGCSIDPNPDSVLAARSLPRGRHRDLATMVREHQTWHKIANAEQTIRTLGIPQSPAMQIMVDADIKLKYLAQGAADPGVPGFESLFDMRVAATREVLDDDDSHNRQSMNRFWLHPGNDPLFVETDQGIFIDRLTVRLGTEKQVLRDNGLRDSDEVDSLARQYAEEFSQRYAAISDAMPVFGDLEQIFRLYAITQILKYRDIPRQIGLDLNFLLHDLELPNDEAWQVPESVPGISRIHEISTPNARKPISLFLSGGVTSRVVLDDQTVVLDQNNIVHAWKQISFSVRPSARVLFWDI